MPVIHIEYHKVSRVFTATDEGGNRVNFQSVPNGNEIGQMEAISSGVRPMQALLMALGACSGIDIVAILEKQRQSYDNFAIKVTAEREEGKIPALWTKAHIDFIFKGTLDADKVNRAAALSIDKYCSVAETLRRAGCLITYNVQLV